MYRRDRKAVGSRRKMPCWLSREQYNKNGLSRKLSRQAVPGKSVLTSDFEILPSEQQAINIVTKETKLMADIPERAARMCVSILNRAARVDHVRLRRQFAELPFAEL